MKKMTSDVKLEGNSVILEGDVTFAAGAEIGGDLALQGSLKVGGHLHLVNCGGTFLDLDGKKKSLESIVMKPIPPSTTCLLIDNFETTTISIAEATIKYAHDINRGVPIGQPLNVEHTELDLVDEIFKLRGLKDDIDNLKKQIEELKASISKINNPPPAPYTFSIMGDVKYLNDGVVRMGVDVKLQEIFDGNAFDIASVISSRGDGSFKITYSSDKLHNPNNPKLFLQAFSSGKPFSNHVEINAGTNDNVELICPPTPSG
jgi:hypothetical protein